MRDDDNKTELFKLLADSMVSSKVFLGRSTVIATKSSEIKSNVSIDASVLSPCNHEEADTGIVLHVLDCIRNGFKEIKIITVDTDVVVIALGLWIEFGVGKHRRWLPIHTYASLLGESKCTALLFWYAFIGCDTVSSFCGRGKKRLGMYGIRSPKLLRLLSI